MKIRYLEKGPSTLSGAALLRQMQNEHTPVLDLLIRESVQNSLDAALPESEYVMVDISDGIFRTEDLSAYFEGIEGNLNQLYPGDQPFLSIRDTGTSGLTGPVSLADVKGSKFGNLQKLIYQIAKPQENSGSGGSWGIGKTIYFRIGNGLVIYYSRILNEETGSYEERLAGMMVEDENHPRILTGNEDQQGIAWWGRPDPKIPSGKETVPLVDDPEIRKILRVFDLEPMTGDETGTMIIIPYVQTDMLLSQTITEMEKEKEVITPIWKESLSEYLSVAVQKWYCPRLDNPEYSGSWLKCRVNGEMITKESFLPLFELMQTLYNNRPENPQFFRGRPVESEHISLRGVFNTSAGSSNAGIISYISVTAEDMLMNPPDNEPSPYADIDREEAEAAREPILAYTRKPGMIVSYETDSNWTHSMPKTDGTEFIICLFRSDQNSVLTDKLITTKVKTLEDYLRNSENADHMGWKDTNLGKENPTIVRKIMTNIKNKISSRYKDSRPSGEKKLNIGLGRKLGSQLLPPEGSSYWDSLVGGSGGSGGSGGGTKTPPGSETGSGGSRKSGFGMSLAGGPEYLRNQVKVPISLNFANEDEGEITILLQTESGKKSDQEWMRDMGTAFPARINSLEILDINAGGSKKRKRADKGYRKKLLFADADTEYEGIEFKFLKSGRTDCYSSVRIRVPSTNKYSVTMILSYSVDGFEGVLDFHKIRKETVKEEGVS